MKSCFTFLFLVLLFNQINAQVTWADDAAEVIYQNCTMCHNPNGIAPNSLMTYAEASAYAPLIQAYVSSNIMPPWTADSSYQHYSQERILTQAERDIILNWVGSGATSGDLSQAPPPPVYNGSQQLPGTPDLVITAPNYMSQATANADDYVCFAIPTGLLVDKKVRAFEVIPGNLETVHHCLVYIDPSGTAVSDTIGGDCGGPASGDLMGGYTPGSTPVVFPSTSTFSSGMVLEAGATIILAMHYPEGSYGTFDQTKVNFYFYDDPVPNFRQIYATPIIQDWSFTIPANTIDSVEVTFNAVINNFTVLSVFPHMHLVGEYIESYATTISNDTIPFIRIPHWDFEWQDFYWFQYMKRLPFGSQIHAKGIYDNTPNNDHNPFNPPQDISAGLNTTDEMFLVYFHYMQYQAGDEFINVDSLTSLFLSQQDYQSKHNPFAIQAHPNPFSIQTTLRYQLATPKNVSLYIYDIQGKRIKRITENQQQKGQQSIIWKGDNDLGVRQPNGIYFYSLLIDGQPYSGKIILQN